MSPPRIVLFLACLSLGCIIRSSSPPQSAAKSEPSTPPVPQPSRVGTVIQNMFKSSDTMTLAAFTTQRPSEGANVRVLCQITLSPGAYEGAYERAKDHDQAYRLHTLKNDKGFKIIKAYVPRELALGKRLYELCKDGESHELTLRLKHIGPDGKPTQPGYRTEGIAILEIID